MFDPSLLALAHGLARGLIYCATVLVIGAGVFHAVVLPRAVRHSPTLARLTPAIARFGRTAALWLIGAYALRFYVQVVDSYGALVPTPTMVRMLLFSTLEWGKGVLAQGIVSVIVFAVWSVSRPSTSLTLLAGLLAGLAVPLTGHAISHGGPLGVTVQGLHVVAAGTWIGTLVIVWYCGRAALDRDDTTAALVAAFSPVALGAAGTVLAAGFGAVLVHVESLGDLFTSPYGWTLFGKIAAYGAAGTMGFVNWKHVTPRLHTADGRRLFSRTAGSELAFALLAIALTSVLTSLPRPGE